MDMGQRHPRVGSGRVRYRKMPKMQSTVVANVSNWFVAEREEVLRSRIRLVMSQTASQVN